MVESYAAMPRRRLTGEMLRDAMLSAAGVLNHKAGGESVWLALPTEVAGTLLKNQFAVTQEVSEQRRRSLFMFARRNARHPIFDLFDRPDALVSCARRETSTTAPQALLLMNSPFAREMAGIAAGQESEELGIQQRIEHGFMRLLSRRVEPAERIVAERYFDQQAEAGIGQQESASDFYLSLMNSNEFLWVD
jgi:hypothetical protein